MRLRTWEPDLLSLTGRIQSFDIDLQPDFQRGDVWNIAKKRKLIDTILRGWTIPPIHLIERPSGPTEVLDGQQRLSAIRDFYDDAFSISGDITPPDANAARLNRKRYSDLDLSDRRQFDNYVLRVVTIYDYLPEEPGELFYRLNEGVKLTPAEQRNALFGPIRDQIKNIVGFFESKGISRDRIGFSNTRMAYEDVISRLIFAIERNSIYTSFSEPEISERFRSRSSANAYVEESILSSVQILSEFLDVSGPIKLNKATLLSVLLFCGHARFSKILDSGIVQLMKFASNSLFASNEFTKTHMHREYKFGVELPRLGHSTWQLALYADIYKDRSSLRVNDASSVVSRDICLHLASRAFGDVMPHNSLRQSICEYIETEALKNPSDLPSLIQSRQVLIDWGQL